MVSNKFYQWGGIAFMPGNLLFIVNKVNEMSRHFLGRPMRDVISGDDILLILIGQIALSIGYVAFYKFYVPRVGRQGKIALTLFSVGGIVLAIGHVAFMSSQTDFMFIFVFLGLLILLIGLIWFGVLDLRQPMMHGWRWLPLATGLFGLIGFFFFSGAEITATFLAFRTLFALGLIGLGFTLWNEKTVQTEFAR